MSDNCPVLKIECPEPSRPVVKSGGFLWFWSGVFTGADAMASLAKTLAFLTFVVITISWFTSERPITELVAVLTLCLGYTAHGKWSWQKYQNGNRNGEHEK